MKKLILFSQTLLCSRRRLSTCINFKDQSALALWGGVVVKRVNSLYVQENVSLQLSQVRSVNTLTRKEKDLSSLLFQGRGLTVGVTWFNKALLALESLRKSVVELTVDISELRVLRGVADDILLKDFEENILEIREDLMKMDTPSFKQGGVNSKFTMADWELASRKPASRRNPRQLKDDGLLSLKEGGLTSDPQDEFIKSFKPTDLRNVYLNKQAIQTLKSIGFESYKVVPCMTTYICDEEAVSTDPGLLGKCQDFLETLDINKVYKGIFMGVTDEKRTYTTPSGGFMLSSRTSPLFLMSKLKVCISQLSLKYVSEDFDSHSLLLKEWLTVKDLETSILSQAKDVIKKIEVKSLARESSTVEELISTRTAEGGDVIESTVECKLINRFNKKIDSLKSYIEKGPIGTYISGVDSAPTANGFKVSVKDVNGLTVSWDDVRELNSQEKWSRRFEGGYWLYYKGTDLLYGEHRYKTDQWAETPKEFEFNGKIASMDVETYSSKGVKGEGCQRPYAVGFTDASGEVTILYKKPEESSVELMKRALDTLMVPKNHKNTVYIHNLKRFDGQFIFEALGSSKDIEAKVTGQGLNEIFKMVLTKSFKDKTRKVKIVIMDSLNLLPLPLRTLAKQFNTEVQKGEFPHSFAVEENLYYVGVSPTDPEDLQWDFKENAVKYLESDVKALYGVVMAYARAVHRNSLLNITDFASYSSLAKGIYSSNYYPKVKSAIPILPLELDTVIRQAYQGGVSHTEKHFMKAASKYDVNSHYPANMLKEMPVGQPRISDKKVLGDIFGYVRAKVTAPTSITCGILPTKDASGAMHCPREGCWVDWYFSEELKNACKYGYKVDVLAAIEFDRDADLFTGFVSDLYRQKAEAKELGDNVSSLMAKLALNSLYGKLGQKRIEHEFKLVETRLLPKLELRYNTDLSKTFGMKTLVRTSGPINSELRGLFIKAGLDEVSRNVGGDSDVGIQPKKATGLKSCVAIAAAITAYSRIEMSRYKNIPGNECYGGDTDSVWLEKPLPESMVGARLGQMKLEEMEEWGLLASKKLYITKSVEGKITIKSRGIGRAMGTGEDILRYDDFEKLFKGERLTLSKTKFLIKDSGIYVQPQKISISLKSEDLENILIEAKDICKDVTHPHHKLALDIVAGVESRGSNLNDDCTEGGEVTSTVADSTEVEGIEDEGVEEGDVGEDVDSEDILEVLTSQTDDEFNGREGVVSEGSGEMLDSGDVLDTCDEGDGTEVSDALDSGDEVNVSNGSGMSDGVDEVNVSNVSDEVNVSNESVEAPDVVWMGQD